jgi:DNA helicase IV
MTMATNMSHVVEFSDAFPIAAIVPTLSAQLSWSKSCMQLCLKHASSWHGAGCCWGTGMTSDDMWVSKGLEFPVVALAGVGYMPAKGEDDQEAARVFYVAATRATQSLVMGGGWRGVG